MSKPLSDDPDFPPEPSLDDDFPPAPLEPSLQLQAMAAPSELPLGAEPSLPQLAQAPAAPPVSDVLTVGGAQYRIVKRIGQGGMGEVFLAKKLGANGFERAVALKTILPHLPTHRTDGPAHLKNFIDEARLAALLQHPNICQVYDLQPVEGRGLLQVLEYIPGRSLSDIVATARRKRTALTEAFACHVAAEVAGALDYAHTATDDAGKPLGIVHRDVTPHNIMVTDAGAVKLFDFGIAFSLIDGREATSALMVKGKEQFFAPEQLLALPLDGRTDEFALALCLFELLALKRFVPKGPTDTETQVHLRIASLTPEAVAAILDTVQIDKTLRDILLHALAPNRDERFARCGDFGDALRVFSQRRNWLFTSADAKKELDALYALPDAVDPGATNSGSRRRSGAPPRLVPGSTQHLPSLTPGRKAAIPAAAQSAPMTPPPLPQAPVAAAAPAPALTPEPQRKLELAFFEAAELSRQAELPQPPSESAQRRRVQLQEELHNPKTSARKQLALPAVVLAVTLVGCLGLVKLLILRTPTRSVATEVVKTPAQLRAEREAQERAAEPNLTPPALAPVDIAQAPPAAAPVPAPVALAAPPSGPQPPPKRRKSTPAAADVDDVLAKQYGGRPVVTADAPAGTVVPTPAVPLGPPRRSLDTVLIHRAPAASAKLPHLPKGTVLTLRLTAPADASQPAPVTAVVVEDVSVAGAVVVPKDTVAICTTAPGNGGRLGLACDTLNLGSTAVIIQAVAMGADRRVGLPLPHASGAAPGQAPGSTAADSALSTARTILGRVSPEGAAGDLTNGAADVVAGAARPGSAPAVTGSSALLPTGTPFTLFLTRALN